MLLELGNISGLLLAFGYRPISSLDLIQKPCPVLAINQ